MTEATKPPSARHRRSRCPTRRASRARCRPGRARRPRPWSSGPATTAPTRSPGTTAWSTSPTDYAERGVRFLAVNSNDAERYPADGPEAMRERFEREALAVSVPARRDQEAARGLGRARRPRTCSCSTPSCGSSTRALPTPTTRIPRCGPVAARGARRRARAATSRPAEHRAGRLLDQVEVRRATAGVTARRRLVRVPASSANLGPGYDVLAAALALELELEVTETGEFSVDAGAGRCRPTAPTSACARSRRLHPADGLRFEIRSEIPLARGLGSSAAAIVAGLVAADHLFELGLERDDDLPPRGRARGPSRQRRRRALRRLRPLPERRRARRAAGAGPARAARGRRGGARDPRRDGADRGGAGGDAGRDLGRPTRSRTSPPRPSSCSGSSAPTSP